MGLVTGVTLPNDGDRIKAQNYNDPINKILAQINGNIDSSNISSISGSKISNSSLPIASFASDVALGWFPSSDVFTYGSNLGDKFYTITTPGDQTAKYSSGMKFKISRSVAPPTQCADFEEGSSQYASKSSPTNIVFTSAFTCEAWVKLESYTATSTAHRTILARRDNSSNGWGMRINPSGQLEVFYLSNPNVTIATTDQSIPINRWIHVAAVVSSVSGRTILTYLNGKQVTNTLSTSGSAALTQSGDLAIGRSGSYATGEFMDGEIADVRLWNLAQTQANIQANMNIQLTGSESGLVGYWKLNGDFNDSTSNANNLTAINGVVATVVDNPMNAVEYGVITKVSYTPSVTTITLYAGFVGNIPNGALSSPNYSTSQSPFNIPLDLCKNITLSNIVRATSFSTTSTSAVQITGLSTTVAVPQNCDRLRVKLQTVSLFCTGGGTAVLSVWDGAVVSGAQLGQVNGGASGISQIIDIPVIPGSTHTFNVGLSASAGTASWSGGITSPSEFVIEAI